jgi:hypothetical protein
VLDHSKTMNGGTALNRKALHAETNAEDGEHFVILETP